MAVVGSAYIVVRALTDRVSSDIKNGFNGVEGATKAAARQAGESLSNAFARGFNAQGTKSMFTRIADGLNAMVPEAKAARETFRDLTKKSYYLQTGLAVLIGAIGAVVGGLISLVSAAAAASAAFIGVINTMVLAKVSMGVAKLALSGVGQAVQAASKQSKGLGKSLKEVREEMQQLRFEAEAAALAEQGAAISLEKARENLARVQNLPPDNLARREAELAYSQAELAYRRAKDKNQDLQDELKNPKKKGAAAQDPFAGLTATQRKFAQYLVSIQGKLKDLKEAAASSFLVELQKQIERIIDKLFPVLDTGFRKISKGLGGAVKNAIKNILDKETIKDIESMFSMAEEMLPKLGDSLGKALSIFLKLMKLTEPLTRKFIDFIQRKLGEFDDYLVNSGSKVSDFFETASALASDFGTIFGNVFDGIKAVILANIGPGSGGQKLVDWLKTATDGLRDMSESPEKMKKLRDLFSGLADNAITIFDGLSGVVGAFLEIGANPKIGETVKILKDAAPDIKDLLTKAVEAGPSLATFITLLVDIANSFADSLAPKIFFDTLNAGTKIFADLVSKPEVQKFIGFFGQMLAFTLAIGAMTTSLAFMGKVLVGNVAAPFELLGKGIDKAKAPIDRMKYSFWQASKNGPNALVKASGKAGLGIMETFGKVGRFFMKTPMLIVIGLLIDKFIKLYDSSKEFKDLVDTSLASIGDSFKVLMDKFKELFDALFGGGENSLINAIGPILTFILYTFVPILTEAIKFIINIVSTVVQVITDIVKTVKDTIGNIIGGIMRMIEGDFIGGLIQVVGGVVVFFVGIIQTVANIFTSIINIAIDGINYVIELIGKIPGAEDMANKFGFSIKNTKIQRIEAVNWTGDITKALNSNLDKRAADIKAKNMANGGVAYPRPGGVLARIAEAGRPERVEPLDENGMSKRDKELFARMGGGGITVIVNPSQGMSETELADKVVQTINREIGKAMYT